jgi:hypothetical protein
MDLVAYVDHLGVGRFTSVRTVLGVKPVPEHLSSVPGPDGAARLTAAEVGAKPFLNLVEHLRAADAGDQQVARGAALHANCGAGADPVFGVASDGDDLVVRHLDAQLVASLTALQPETV